MNRFNRLLIFIACLAPVTGLGALALFFCWDTGYHARYWERYRLEGDRLVIEGHLDEAAKAYLLATAEARHLGNSDEGLASTLVALAETFDRLEKPDEAQRYYREALEILSGSKIDASHQDSAAAFETRALVGLSKSLFARGKLQEAEQVALEALGRFTPDAGIATELDNGGRAALATDLYILAQIRRSQNQKAEARQLFTRALAVAQGVPALSTLRGNLISELSGTGQTKAVWYAAAPHAVSKDLAALLERAEKATGLRRLQEGRKLYDQALALAVKNKEPGMLSSIYANIAAIYTEEGKWMFAVDFYKKAFETLKPPVSLEGDRLLMAMNSILSEEKEFAELAVWCEKQLEVRKQLFGDTDLRTLTSSYDLVHCLRECHDPARLWNATISALDRFDRAGRYTDRRYDEILSAVLPVSNRLGRIDEAIAILRNDFERRQRRYGPDSLVLRPSCFWLGSAYFVKSRYEEAMPYLEKAWSMSRGRFLADLETAQCVKRLAGCLRAQKRVPEGKALIQQYFMMVRNARGDKAVMAIPAVELAIIYKAENDQGQYEKCMEWAKERASHLGSRMAQYQLRLIERVEYFLDRGKSIEPSYLDNRTLY